MTDLAATLAADLARLGARPYAEVGVPMILLAEDLRGGARVVPAQAADAPVLALRDRLRTVADTGHPVATSAATARLLEVLADRTLLGPDGPDFTRLSGSAEKA